MFGKRGIADITWYCWFVSGVGFVSYGSVGYSFTLIGLDHRTRAVLSKSQVSIIKNHPRGLVSWASRPPNKTILSVFWATNHQTEWTREGTSLYVRSVAVNWIFSFLHNILWHKHSLFQKLTGVVHVCCKSDKSSSNLKAFSRKPQSSPSKRSWESKNQKKNISLKRYFT